MDEPADVIRDKSGHYPYVSVVNSTPFDVYNGVVNYADDVDCSADNFTLSATPGTSWQATSRGVCLVTSITASVSTPGGAVDAGPYSSSGTAYSQFAVIQTNNNPPQFQITRIVT